MWSEVIEDTQAKDFPLFETIKKGSIVYVVGQVLDEGVICIRYNGKTRMIDVNCLKDAKILKKRGE